MIVFDNKTFDEERALYGMTDICIKNCKFDGPADGESAIKECADVKVENSYFNLRYPFWHVSGLEISGCELTDLCRAALWYSDNIVIKDTKLYGIKALRECKDIVLIKCDIVSPEFGWSSTDIEMFDSVAESEYFMLRAMNLIFSGVKMKGKYSFQYIENSVFDNCVFDTKDAFWHAKDIVIRNSVVKGEYLAWYSENIVFENCHISGTQPLCYCKNLKLINCTMEGADFAFEKSAVEATINSPVISIKNPLSGIINVKSVDEIIRDDISSKGIIKIIE